MSLTLGQSYIRTKCKWFLPFQQYIHHFIPPSPPEPHPLQIKQLIEFIQNKSNLSIITGAGFSTESGIPDYRGPNGAYSKGHKPIHYSDFVSSTHFQKRYWARSFLGWQVMLQAQPNLGHYSLSQLEMKGVIKSLITQNVDRLHQKAGSKSVIELHGSIHEIICIKCKKIMGREQFQSILLDMNPSWKQILKEKAELGIRPDGDVELNGLDFTSFQIPSCYQCNGILKPNLIFFGENVSKDQVEKIMQIVKQSDGLILAGTSVSVYSSFRFARVAHDLNIPIAIINIGETRADELSFLKIEALCSQVFDQIAKEFIN